MDFGEVRAEDELVGKAQQGDADESCGGAVFVAHAFDGVLQGLHGVAAAREQAASGFGEFDAAGAVGEERQADVLFQRF